jgi:hypothetical protein
MVMAVARGLRAGATVGMEQVLPLDALAQDRFVARGCAFDLFDGRDTAGFVVRQGARR